MSDVPDFAQEIERKAIDELQRIMHGLTTRRVGVIAANASLKTLWEATSGLVSQETMTLIGQSATGVEKAMNAKVRPEEVAMFVGPTSYAVVQRLLDRVVIAMGSSTVGDGKQEVGRNLTPPVEELNQAAWCVEKFKATCEQLGKSMKRAL